MTGMALDLGRYRLLVQLGGPLMTRRLSERGEGWWTEIVQLGPLFLSLSRNRIKPVRR